jgi:nitrite reductase/ring-hydroxylating ferredoxin subunit
MSADREDESYPDQERRVPLDVLVNSSDREGLTGTTSADIYKPLHDREQVTIPPDWKSLHSQPAWRKDFPIDWPQDHYVARRDFTKFLALTSLAFAVGQIWIGVQNWWRRSRGRPEIRRVASLASLPVGQSLIFSYPQEHDTCILIRLDANVLVAYSQKCTHLSCAVIPQVETGILHCPCHEGYFELRSGNVLAGPPPRPLPRIALEVRGDDVYATGIDWRTI